MSRIEINTNTGEVTTIKPTPEEQTLENSKIGKEHLEGAWDVSEGVIVINLDRAILIIKNDIKEAMLSRINDGIKWAFNPGSTEYSIPLDIGMSSFLSRNLMKLNEGRLSPHDGFIFNGTENFSINDDGFKELALFSGEWGDEVSRIRLSEIDSLSSMTEQELIDYDVNSIDWSVDWSKDSQNNGNGWDNDRVTQNP